jgi:hydroxymethylpyrimidine pyrophosphatase-like HAD family hydrolase
MFADWDKASGVVRAAAEVLGQDLADPGWSWLFVGDSANDASAFAHFPLSVGVQNVRDHLAHLPAPPRYVTAGDRGRGFAELTHLLLGARNAGSSD